MQKKNGNESFKAKKYKEAIEFYKDAVEVLELMKNDEEATKDLKVLCH
jgi:hypothetical protein